MSLKTITTIVCFTIFLFLSSRPAAASNWSNPLDNTLNRASYKGFGQFFDKSFYVEKGGLFPNPFVGYHSGVDLEIFPEETEKNVPVYAISSGKISFIGSVSGYGGLILEKIDNEDVTALYGHLKSENNIVKVGDQVETGEIIGYLGDGFSKDTGGERKHLHLGFYKGRDLYFKGYEQDDNIIQTKWLNPLDFLKGKVGTLPIEQEPSVTPPPIVDLWSRIRVFFSDLLKNLNNYVR